MASKSYIVLGMIISMPCRNRHSDFKKGAWGGMVHTCGLVCTWISMLHVFVKR